VTIPDLGEAFDRALRTSKSLNADQEFDIVVHSTGMLVLREWMTRGPLRRSRVKHLIGLAPATWGSPLAHKGNSLLGAVFKGERHWGPDFLEAGKQILIGLELGSPYTWRLAEQDLLASEVWYGEDDTTPWPFIFVGTDDYGGLRRAVNEPGTDGTVRWSGVGFNSRKFRLDLTLENQGAATLDSWRNVDVPLVFVPERNHGSILHEPSNELAKMISSALDVDSRGAYDEWRSLNAWKLSDGGRHTQGHLWQQFVIRAVDERGAPVPDWFLELCTVGEDDRLDRIDAFDLDVHTFGADPSYRCFHVDLAEFDGVGSRLAIRLSARSGTDYIAYYGVKSQNLTRDGERTVSVAEQKNAVDDESVLKYKWDAQLVFDDIVQAEGDGEARLLYPFTTTLIEVVFNREPLPPEGVNRVLWFIEQQADGAGSA